MMREARAKLASSTAAPAIQRGYELAWTTIDDVEPEVVQAVSRRERARGDVLVGFEPGELAEIATMAARPALAAKFPGRLERLVEAGRLPRCA